MLQRIRERAVFDRFPRDGRRVRHGHVWMSFIPDPGGAARVAFAVGRSVGSATVRNRARRRLRAALDARRNQLPGGWFLVGAAPSITRSTFQEIEADIDAILDELRARA